jgi:DNA uptake protein ComE-like DNA-binding protein
MTVLKQMILNWVVERLQLIGRSMSAPLESPGQRSRPVMPWQLLRQKITNDPYYRFESLSEIKIAAEHGIRIDANTAAVDDWLRLPGISIHQARLLTQLIDAGLQFYCIEDVAAALGVSIQRLKPIEPILQFCYYDLESIHHVERVSLNAATPEALIKLPGVGPVLARAIVRDRTSRGAFVNLVDLQERLSLPDAMTADLMHYLKF